MLRNFKKLISLVLVLALSVIVSLPAFADVNHNSVKDSGVKDSAITYIPEADAVLLANQCIKEQIKLGDHCPWNDTTKIGETVAFYDFNGKANAFLFRLKTNDKQNGYIFVNAISDEPDVMAFGYDCNFMLDQANIKYANCLVSSNDHILYCGGMTFLRQLNKTKLKNVITDNTEKESEKTIKDSYQQLLTQTRNNTKYNEFKSGIKIQGQIIYKSDDLDGLWDNTSDNIYTTDQFPQDNNCAATASTNFMYYWANLRPDNVPAVWSDATDVESSLYDYLYTNVGVPGTMPWNIIPGLTNYASACGYPINGSDEQNTNTSLNWSWFEQNIKHNIPILFTVILDPKYSQHVMLAVGYQNTSTGDYLRIADGWTNTYSNFYKIMNPNGARVDAMSDACYVRW
jgi:hypothetical protein